MGDLEDLLEPVAKKAQKEVQSRLTGFFGAMVRPYLPQTWVFVTEQGTASLHVDARGAVAVHPGAMRAPDVTVDVELARLRAALTGPHPPAERPQDLRVTTHSAKGKAAFGLLRERLGL